MHSISFRFVLFLILTFNTMLAQDGRQMKFEQYTSNDGLSQSSITCILKDSRGFMWFGTEDGLNKYDGYRFKAYKNIPGDSSSLSGSYINDIAEDESGQLWIGTSNGLNIYDRKTESFKWYKNKPDDPNSLSNNDVLAISLEDSGDVWIGTASGLNKFHLIGERFSTFVPSSIGDEADFKVRTVLRTESRSLWVGAGNNLYQFDTKAEKFIKYQIPEDQNRNDFISALYEDTGGNLWVGTHNGLYQFNSSKGTFKSVWFYHQEPALYTDKLVHSVTQRSQYSFWLCTQMGLIMYDIKTGKFQNLSDSLDPNQLYSRYITDVYLDASGTLWIGSLGGGIYKHDPHRWRFNYFETLPASVISTIETGVRALVQDKNPSIWWIGTYDGLVKFNRNTGDFTHYKHQPGNPNSLSSNAIKSLLVDSSGNLWIGTWANGLNKLDQANGRFTRYFNLPNDGPPIMAVRAMLEDNEGHLWFATDNGLLKWDQKTGGTKRFLQRADDLNSLSNNDLISLYLDSHQKLWIGTAQGGLNSFDRENESFTRYMHQNGKAGTLSHMYVTSILEGELGVMWVGTYGGGLNKLNLETGQFQYYNTTNGLPNDVVYGILSDDRGFLWISSNEGISRFDPTRETFKTYGAKDGMRSKEFNVGSYYKSKSGEMMFGGLGFYAFHPDSIRDNRIVPRIVFSDFKIFNKTVAISIDGPLKESIAEVKQITLSHNQSVSSFEFMALNYTNPEKNQYAYKLEGFDQDWQYLGSRNFMTFTNLDPGQYTLRVKGSNNDGIWNEQGASIRLVITPPWWRTWWAYILYAIVGLLILWLFRRNVIRRERLKAQYQLEHLKLEKVKELDRLKSTFFENISHEFRTPLTLILGTTEKALTTTTFDKKQKQGYGLIHRSAQRLLSLINQLLDLSKLEAGSMTLQAGFYDLIDFLKPITAAFGSLAQSREIHFLTNFPYDHLHLYFDKDKLEKVINNLLANAFKFTAEKGHVAITVSKHTSDESERVSFEQGFAKVTIQDNGKGLAPDQIEKVFDRFYQVNDSMTREHEGTGIGLSLSKELVELHGGMIQVESRSNKGSTFKVLLPLGKGHLKESDLIKDGSRAAPVLDFTISKSDMPRSRPLPIESAGLPKILIVEDNQEMRDYLEDILSSHYFVVQAPNGQEALALLKDNHPDLIISDVMMPKMDGIAFCKELKKSEETNYIPVIMLTARADQGSKEEGFGIGADAYLTKPFGTKELLVRVKNLLIQRRLLKERFKRELFLKPKEVAITSKDERFLNKVMESIDQHLSDEYFNVDQLAKEVGLSKPQITKRLNILTEHTPNQLIQKFRLERAKKLLLHDAGRIAEIAYEVGFSSPAYFTKVFKEKFGMSPREFKKGIYKRNL